MKKPKLTKEGKRLKSSENLRKDGVYQYRYKDNNGKYKYIYSKSLHELRIKEARVEDDLIAGINPYEADMTVIELITRYVNLKQGVRYNTKVGHEYVLNLMEKEEFGMRKIREVKVSDAKAWFVSLQRSGRSYSVIMAIRGVVKPAFQSAFEDDLIIRNPFNFELRGLIRNDTSERKPLTLEQQKVWLSFMRDDRTYSKYYDEIVVLLETGVRVSEFCGLTVHDIDFVNDCIYVNKQLLRTRNGIYFVEETKTKCGRRKIPMTQAVKDSLLRLVEKRKAFGTGVSVDGFEDFLTFDKNGNPKVALHIENEIRWALAKFRKQYPEMEEFNISPHILRHTFATNNARYGMGIKSSQLLMGHSEPQITMEVYTASDYSQAAQEIVSVSNMLHDTFEEESPKT